MYPISYACGAYHTIWYVTDLWDFGYLGGVGVHHRPGSFPVQPCRRRGPAPPAVYLAAAKVGTVIKGHAVNVCRRCHAVEEPENMRAKRGNSFTNTPVDE